MLRQDFKEREGIQEALMLTLRSIFMRAVSARDRIQEPLEYGAGGRQGEWAQAMGKHTWRGTWEGLARASLGFDGMVAEKTAGLENVLVISRAVSRPQERSEVGRIGTGEQQRTGS